MRFFNHTKAANKDLAEIHFTDLLASLMGMAWFVEARDPYTGGHLWRVSKYSRLLATTVGLDDADAVHVGLGGFLHDLGKIGVPDAILRKPDRLTDAEYAVIKTHPEVGMRMLASHPLATLVGDAVLRHHERPDGNGYPRGLSGQAIPETARIVAVCDAFDAMASHRPYRPGMPRDKALSVIDSLKSAQFDARLAAIFVDLGKRGELDHIMGHSDEGIPLQTCPMCGPTLVVRREQHAGDQIHCRSCGSEFVLKQRDSTLAAQPTGRKGKAIDLEPDIDNALITRTVRDAVTALPVAELLQRSRPPEASA